MQARLLVYSLRAAGDRTDGRITGYYEPVYPGSLTRTAVASVPVYGVPDDLIVINLKSIYPKLKGKDANSVPVVSGLVEAGKSGKHYFHYDWPTPGELANQTDESLEAIGYLIETINDINVQIASALEEQTSVAEEVSRGMIQIAQSVDSVADDV